MLRYLLSALALGLLLTTAHSSAPATYFVALDGNDAWSGTMANPTPDKRDGPFATLEKARDTLRKRSAQEGLPEGGAAIVVRGGHYYLKHTFRLEEEDSGTRNAPVLYMAYPGEEVHLIGGQRIPEFTQVQDPAMLSQLDPSARERVRVADLKAIGIVDYGNADKGGVEFFFRDQPGTLARWPNDSFVRIADIVVDDDHKIHGIKGSTVGKFKYEEDRPSRWVQEQDPWLHGYWFWDWSEQRQPLASIDTANKIMSLKEPYHNYGYRKGQWYYAFNMLSELDAPGEWYLDREKGLFYFWPPESSGTEDVTVSTLDTLVSIENASHVALAGFTLELARGTAVRVSGGTGNEVSGCLIRNVGGGGVSMGGKSGGVRGCEIYNTGDGGISLNGGDRTTLTAGGLYAVDNHIHNYGRINRMYTPGIAINGVGLIVANNLIHTAPHMAIQFSGNEHLIELNEIYDVCQESNDAGAMYAGRDWTMRGNVIRHNYLHDITGFENRGCVGVYLDDMFASAAIEGNLFVRVTRAAFIGGGRDCTIENNLFVDCDPAIHVDARALGWAGYHADEWLVEAAEKGTIKGLAFDKPPYSERYPQLLTLIEDEPKAPKGNLIARNIIVGGRAEEIEEKARPYLTQYVDNLVDADPMFMDADAHDYRLKESSPAFGFGFKPIPFESIGPFKRAGSIQQAVDTLYRRVNTALSETN